MKPDEKFISGSNTIRYKVLEENQRIQIDLQAPMKIEKVPNTPETMSYTSVNEEGNFDLYQFEIKSLEGFFVAELPIGVQDII